MLSQLNCPQRCHQKQFAVNDVTQHSRRQIDWEAKRQEAITKKAIINSLQRKYFAMSVKVTTKRELNHESINTDAIKITISKIMCVYELN